MNILITGGCGFLGARLARTLLAQGSLAVAGEPARPIKTITLADRAPPPDDLAADPRVRFAVGDLNAQVTSGALPAAGTDVVFQLLALLVATDALLSVRCTTLDGSDPKTLIDRAWSICTVANSLNRGVPTTLKVL